MSDDSFPTDDRPIDFQRRPPTEPPRTDADVEALVLRLLQHALRRQCWIVFLGDVPDVVPLVMPISDLPYEPDDCVDQFGMLLHEIGESVGATGVLVVWERPHTTTMYPIDWAWVDAVACVCAEQGVFVRAQVLMSEDGASVIDLRDDELAMAG